MNISRRGIIGGLIVVIAAPAIVKYEWLMPVKKIVAPMDWWYINIETIRNTTFYQTKWHQENLFEIIYGKKDLIGVEFGVNLNDMEMKDEYFTQRNL